MLSENRIARRSKRVVPTLPPDSGQFLNRVKHRAILAAWAVAALINIAAGIALESQPSRQVDALHVRMWTSKWLLDGMNVYTIDDAAVYPPHGIVALSPIALIPERWI